MMIAKTLLKISFYISNLIERRLKTGLEINCNFFPKILIDALKSKFDGGNPIKVGVNVVGFSFPTNLSKLLQKGMCVQYLKKIGRKLRLLEILF